MQRAWERIEKCTRFWWGKPEGKRPFGRPRRRWKDGIRLNLTEIDWRGLEWIQLAQDRYRWQALVNAVMDLWALMPRR
jgi:hypothetical protein